MINSDGRTYGVDGGVISDDRLRWVGTRCGRGVATICQGAGDSTGGSLVTWGRHAGAGGVATICQGAGDSAGGSLVAWGRHAGAGDVVHGNALAGARGGVGVAGGDHGGRRAADTGGDGDGVSRVGSRAAGGVAAPRAIIAFAVAVRALGVAVWRALSRGKADQAQERDVAEHGTRSLSDVLVLCVPSSMMTGTRQKTKVMEHSERRHRLQYV